MQPRQNGKKQNAISERSLKRVLADSGYSEDVADKIWKWYNPQTKVWKHYQESLGEQQILKILVTGAFGNIGKAVIEEAHKRTHEIIVFEIENKKTRKDARKYRHKVKEVIFGDIRNFEDVKKAVQQSEIVIHLAQ